MAFQEFGRIAEPPYFEFDVRDSKVASKLSSHFRQIAADCPRNGEILMMMGASEAMSVANLIDARGKVDSNTAVHAVRMGVLSGIRTTLNAVWGSTAGASGLIALVCFIAQPSGGTATTMKGFVAGLLAVALAAIACAVEIHFRSKKFFKATP